jgi:cell wall-associated NlpC family hydrolase
MKDVEPRTTLARPDLADLRLEGLIRAGRFAEARPMTCAVASAALRAQRRAESEQQSQLLYGERFDVLEVKAGWAWGQAQRDGYVGFVRLDDLQPAADPPTHRVRTLRTIGFSKPDIKSEPAAFLSMNALVTAGESEGRFVHAGAAGWIVEAHLAAVGDFEADPAEVALAFLGAPYLWGGRDSLGLDCSGLIQQALFACGRACPRDTDLQMAAFTRHASIKDLERGDLVFWKGHVAMMVDAKRMVHANAHHMAVAVEPLAKAIARIRSAGSGEPIAHRRP